MRRYFLGMAGRFQRLPDTVDDPNLWPAQRAAMVDLERSLKLNKPRALIQMATGSGKTFTAISSIYRLIRHADAKRVLFLVDRANQVVSVPLARNAVTVAIQEVGVITRPAVILEESLCFPLRTKRIAIHVSGAR